MTVRILRVFSVGGHRHPQVLAYADGREVRWYPELGWVCICSTDPTCPHITAVAELLDPRVTTRSARPRTPDRARQVRRGSGPVT
ncbi:hypothetical protein GCM10028783_30390 [Modestobacter muralis]